MRKRLRHLGALAAVFAAPIAAQPAPEPAARTVQQRFDSAAAKLAARDWAGALADLDALEADLAAPDRPGSANLALVRASRGEALQHLGRVADARATLAQALESGGLEHPSLLGERDAARIRLARLEEFEHDHAAANRNFLTLAESTGDELTKIVALTGAARTEMFVDAAAALRHIDEALALTEAATGLGKEELSTVLGLKGRVLLNAGRFEEAQELLRRAVSLRGGLGTRVDQGDIALRSDMALALLRAGDTEEARRYLAYTGAGRTEENLQTPAEMSLPACGGVAGLRPEDVAVVQFAILSDGTVVGAQPILASRPGEMAYDFARAVNGWRWDAEAAEQIDPFFRVATRVEVRCTNSVKRPPVTAEIDRALTGWMESKGIDLAERDSVVAPVEQLEAQLAAESGVHKRLEAMIELGRHPGVGHKKSRAYIGDALALIRTADAPPAAIVSVAVSDADLSVRYGSNYRAWNARTAAALTPLLGDPIVANDPRLRATVRLILADRYAEARAGDAEVAALRGVTEDAGLSDRDPLKIGALVMLANIAANEGRLAEAQAAYQRTGLTAQQCALIDGGPVMRRTGASSSDFPREAMRWGFEGWTSVEFDIDAEGRTANRRIIAAYPPAVFAEASAGILDDARYRASYRPEGDLGCGGQTQRVVFKLPG